MKKVNMGRGDEVKTPWLTINEAAVYCNMGREKFLRTAERWDVSHGGGSGPDRSYHVNTLDRMMRQAGYYPSEIEGEEGAEC